MYIYIHIHTYTYTHIHILIINLISHHIMYYFMRIGAHFELPGGIGTRIAMTHAMTHEDTWTQLSTHGGKGDRG